MLKLNQNARTQFLDEILAEQSQKTPKEKACFRLFLNTTAKVSKLRTTYVWLLLTYRIHSKFQK